MIKVYRKTATIRAEQFDGSNEMVKKYNITPPMPLDPDYTINTLEDDIKKLRSWNYDFHGNAEQFKT